MFFKEGYRKHLIDRILLHTSLQREAKINLCSAIEMLRAVLMSISASPIVNSFRHALCEVPTRDSTRAKSDGTVTAKENVVKKAEAS